MSEQKTSDTDQRLRQWTKPTVQVVGTLGEVLKSGSGKVSILVHDPGEARKVSVQG